MRSIAYGGNRNIFNVILDNNLEKVPLIFNYNHPAIQIYVTNLLAKMDGDWVSKSLPPCFLKPGKPPKRSRSVRTRSVRKFRESFVKKQDKFVNGMELMWAKGTNKVVTKIKKI